MTDLDIDDLFYIEKIVTFLKDFHPIGMTFLLSRLLIE
jgi:hypothetical protein